MRRLLLILALALLSGCGGSTPSTAGQPSPSQVALTCTTSGAASSSWPGPQSPSTAIVAAEATGDTLKLAFTSGTPQFELTPVGSAHLTADPSGRPVDLAGSSGVRIVLRGFRGDMSNYTGPARLPSSGPILLEVGAIGDFEGVVGFGAGLSRPGCANVTASGSTLTFRFIAAP